MKKLIAKLALGAVALSLTFGIAPSVSQAAFADQNEIPSWAASSIDDLVSQGVIKGYADGRFGPNDPMTRAQFAKVVILASSRSVNSSATSSFSDVAAGHWAVPYIEAARDASIIGGYADGRFGPDDQVTRAQAAKMLVMAFDFDEDTANGPTFPDVSVSDWFYPYVETAYANGVINGYADGRFGPNDSVTRAQVAKMTVAAQNPSDTPVDPPAADVLGISSAAADSSSLATIYFNQAVSADTAEVIANYSILDSDSSELEVLDAELAYDGMSVTLSTDAQVGDELYTITVLGVESEDGSLAIDEDNDTVTFYGYSVPLSDNTLDLALAADTPAAASIPVGAFNVPYTRVDFTAGDQEDVRITSITLTRLGVGRSTDFEEVNLYEGIRRISSSRSFTTDNNQAKFTFTSRPIVIEQGTTKTIEIRGSLATSASSNGQNSIALLSADHLEAVGVESGGQVIADGDFPINGNTMSNINVTAGTLEVEDGSTPQTTAEIGNNDVRVAQLKLKESSGNEDVLITSIILENKGSADSGDISNVKMIDTSTGEQIAQTAQLDDLGRVHFDLTSLSDGKDQGGFWIDDGSTRRIDITVDINDGINETIRFTLDELSDITAIGQTLGYGVQVTNGTSTFGSFNSSNGVSIEGGQLTFDFQKPEETDVAIDSEDVTIAKLNITNRGEGVLVRDLNIAAGVILTGSETNTANFGTQIRNVRLVDENGTTVSGPVDVVTPSSLTVNGSGVTVTAARGTAGLIDYGLIKFTDDFEVPQIINTKTYYMIADLQDGLEAGQQIQLSFGPQSTPSDTSEGFFGQGIVTNDTLTTNDLQSALITSDLVTAQQEQLVLSLDNSIVSQKVIRGNTEDVLGVIMTAGRAGDVVLTQLTFDFATVTGATVMQSDDLIKIQLIDETTGSVIDEDVVASSSTSVIFDQFSPIVIAAGEQQIFTVRVQVSSAATAGHVVALKLDAVSSDVQAEDADGNSLADAQITVSDGTSTALNNNGGVTYSASSESITAGTGFIIANEGTLKVTRSSSTPSAAQVMAGAEAVSVAKVQFEAKDEDIYVDRLILAIGDPNTADGSNDSAVGDQINYLRLFDGTTELASAKAVSNNTADWILTGDQRISVPEDGNKTITIKADFNISKNGAAEVSQPVHVYVRSVEATGTKVDVTPTIGESARSGGGTSVNTALTAAATAAATTVTLDAGAGLTINSLFKVGDELMLATADGGGGVYTVTRGVSGTTAAAHAAADAVEVISSTVYIDEGAAYSSSDTTLSLTAGTIGTVGIVPGDILEIGNEHVVVTATNSAGNTVTVSRAVDQTTATEHTNVTPVVVRKRVKSNSFTPQNTLLSANVHSDTSIYGVQTPSTTQDLFRFTIAAASNTADNSTIEAKIRKIRVTITGSAGAGNFYLRNYDRQQNISGVTITNNGHPGEGTTEMILDLSNVEDDQDYLINDGESITYALRGEVDASGATSTATKTLRFAISRLGENESTSHFDSEEGTTNRGDILWTDDSLSDGVDYPTQVNWVDQAEDNATAPVIVYTTSISTSTDTTGPAAITVASGAGTTTNMLVTFDQAVNKVDAETITNYDEGGTCVVTSATLIKPTVAWLVGTGMAAADTIQIDGTTEVITDNRGNANTDTTAVAAIDDAAAPTISSAKVVGNGLIEVTLSEPLAETAAETVTNWDIVVNSAAAVNPTAADLLEDYSRVLLTTSALNTSDTVTVDAAVGVTDILGNANADGAATVTMTF